MAILTINMSNNFIAGNYFDGADFVLSVEMKLFDLRLTKASKLNKRRSWTKDYKLLVRSNYYLKSTTSSTSDWVWNQVDTQVDQLDRQALRLINSIGKHQFTSWPVSQIYKRTLNIVTMPENRQQSMMHFRDLRYAYVYTSSRKPIPAKRRRCDSGGSAVSPGERKHGSFSFIRSFFHLNGKERKDVSKKSSSMPSLGGAVETKERSSRSRYLSEWNYTITSEARIDHHLNIRCSGERHSWKTKLRLIIIIYIVTFLLNNIYIGAYILYVQMHMWTLYLLTHFYIYDDQLYGVDIYIFLYAACVRTQWRI